MKKEELERKLLINDPVILSNFIEKEFLEVDNDIPSKLTNNIDSLKKIDRDILNQIIAKMDCMKADFEYHSQVTTVLSMMIAALTFFINFAIMDENKNGWFYVFFVFSIVALVISIGILTIQLLRQKKRTTIAVYFKSLLVETKNSLNQSDNV